jgi:hypothetical protein
MQLDVLFGHGSQLSLGTQYVYLDRNRYGSIPIQFGRHVFPDIFLQSLKQKGNSFLILKCNRSNFLVLLGQLLEARAHSQTSSAIKELLKLAPTEATLVENERIK